MTEAGQGHLELPWAAWFGDRARRLPMPDGWEILPCPIRGGTPVGPQEVLEALRRPVGTAPLRELARGKASACVAVEDLSRPSPLGPILRPLLEELDRAGLGPDRVRVLVALGGHAPMDRREMARKLGPWVLRRYEVLNHHPYENLVDLGTSERGIPIRINRVFAESELKLAVGSVVPHPYAGFGGGAKIVLPGVAGMETLEANHRPAVTGLRGGFGDVEGNPARREMEEIARRVGLAFIVNVVPDARRRPVGIHAGDPVAAHRQAVRQARRVFATPRPPEVDAVVLNAYPKDTELLQVGNAFNPLRFCPPIPVRPGGLVLVTAACPKGRGYHSLHGPGGRLWRPPVRREWLGERQVVLFSPNLNAYDARISFWEGYPFFRSWPAVRRYLRESLGPRARVAVFPTAPLQIMEASP
jgi:nickel-dependent lactate racemase